MNGSMPTPAEGRRGSSLKEPLDSPSSSLREPLWRRGIHLENVVLIAAVAFALGLLVGRTGQVRSALARAGAGPHAGLAGPLAEDPHAGLDLSPAPEPDREALEEALAAARREFSGAQEDVGELRRAVEELVRLGNQAFDEGERRRDPLLFARAIAAYEQALKLRPGDPNVQTDLGIAYRNIGRPDRAIEHFQAAQASDPRHLQSQVNLAVVYLDLGEAQKAAEAAERCLSLDPPPEIASLAQSLLTQARQQMTGGKD